MAKLRTKYICQQCGGEQNKWAGKCPDCGAWNTLEETTEVPQSAVQQRRPTALGGSSIAQGTQIPLILPDIKPLAQERISVGYTEMDRVLGGGLVAGSLVLIGGEPGIGKSTLLLQAAKSLAGRGEKVLYVSGEESLRQVRLRAERLGAMSPGLLVLAETDPEAACEEAARLAPAAVVVDSVQAMASSVAPSAAGSVAQVRTAALLLQHFAREKGVPVVLIGHVT